MHMLTERHASNASVGGLCSEQVRPYFSDFALVSINTCSLLSLGHYVFNFDCIQILMQYCTKYISHS